MGMSLSKQTPGKDRRDQADRAEIKEQRKPAGCLFDGLRKRQAHSGKPFELSQPLVDEVEADMLHPIVVSPAPPPTRARRIASHVTSLSDSRLLFAVCSTT